jgi:hypothetical protein
MILKKLIKFLNKFGYGIMYFKLNPLEIVNDEPTITIKIAKKIKDPSES